MKSFVNQDLFVFLKPMQNKSKMKNNNNNNKNTALVSKTFNEYLTPESLLLH